MKDQMKGYDFSLNSPKLQQHIDALAQRPKSVCHFDASLGYHMHYSSCDRPAVANVHVTDSGGKLGLSRCCQAHLDINYGKYIDWYELDQWPPNVIEYRDPGDEDG